MTPSERTSSSMPPTCADDFVALAEEVSGLVERLRTGSSGALAEFFELAPGAEVVATESRELAR